MKEAKDPIVQEGAAVLRQKAKPLAHKEFGSRTLKALIAKMKKALENEEYGVAIAAPQVGVPVRLFIVAGRVFEEETKSKTRSKKSVSADTKNSSEVPAKRTSEERVFINPEIIRLSRKKKEMSEGCLSVRGKYGTVLRHDRATIRAQDETGSFLTYHGAGLLAQVFQHEVEHLDGILFIDKAERMWDDPDLENHA
jgi:peptide deformylase